MTTDDTSRVDWDSIEATAVGDMLSLREFDALFGSAEEAATQYKGPSSKAARLLGALSGTDWDSVVSRSAERRQVLLAVFIAAAALVTGLVSAVSASAVGAPFAAAASVGVVAAVFTALLDSLLISSPKSGRVISDFARAVPRLAIVALMSLLYTSALMLTVFSTDIAAIVEENRAVEAERAAASTLSQFVEPSEPTTSLTAIDESVAGLQGRLSELEVVIQSELALLEPSAEFEPVRPGFGARDARLASLLDEEQELRRRLGDLDEQRMLEARQLAETAAARNAQADQQYAALQEQASFAAAEVIARPESISERLFALEQLQQRLGVWINWLMSVLIFVVLSAPVFASWQRSSHDLLRLEQDRAMRAAIARSAALEAELSADMSLLEKYAHQRRTLDGLGLPIETQALLSGFTSDKSSPAT